MVTTHPSHSHPEADGTAIASRAANDAYPNFALSRFLAPARRVAGLMACLEQRNCSSMIYELRFDKYAIEKS